MILVYITCKGRKEAGRISRHLLNKKLIACANIFPITSVYCWKGKQCNDKEIVLLAKTKNNKYTAVKKEVKKLHSYDVPCIMKIKADTNKEYGQWVNKEVK